MPYKYKEYQKEYQKQYRIKNMDKLKKQSQQWRENNQEKIKESYMKYYLENHDRELERQKRQREFNPKYMEEYREKHKEEIRDERIKRKEVRRLYLDEYKLSKGCQICGYNKCAIALDFHHNNGDKIFCLASSTGYKRNLKRIEEEIKKCIVLCANCHRELHYIETNKNKKEMIITNVV